VTKLPLILLLIALIEVTGCRSRLSTNPIPGTPMLAATMPAGSIRLTPANTQIRFVGSALLASHEGTFTRFSGYVACPDSTVQHAQISISIDMDSVYTEIPLLTKHLKAADFFDVVQYPHATFVSTGISTNSAVAPKYILAGNLTLHGVTKAVSFPAQLKIDPAQIALDATIIIRQDEFKMASARNTTNEVPVTVTVRISRQQNPQAGL
jgi:polyisoprenoid-binding protein YceI